MGLFFINSAEEIAKKVADEMKERGSVLINWKERYLPIVDFDTKLKGGTSKHYQILWHKMDDKLDEGNISNKALEWLDKLKTTVSGNPRVYLDNTRDFIKEKTN